MDGDYMKARAPESGVTGSQGLSICHPGCPLEWAAFGNSRSLDSNVLSWGSAPLLPHCLSILRAL